MSEQARLVMVTHPVLESRFFAATDEIAELDALRAPAALDPCDRGGVLRRASWPAGPEALFGILRATCPV